MSFNARDEAARLNAMIEAETGMRFCGAIFEHMVSTLQRAYDEGQRQLSEKAIRGLTR